MNRVYVAKGAASLANATLRFDPASGELDMQSAFEVEVRLDPSEQLVRSLEIFIDYPPEVVTFVSGATEDGAGDWDGGTTTDPTEVDADDLGTLSFIAAASGDVTTADTLVATITFTITEPESFTLSYLNEGATLTVAKNAADATLSMDLEDGVYTVDVGTLTALDEVGVLTPVSNVRVMVLISEAIKVYTNGENDVTQDEVGDWVTKNEYYDRYDAHLAELVEARTQYSNAGFLADIFVFEMFPHPDATHDQVPRNIFPMSPNNPALVPGDDEWTYVPIRGDWVVADQDEEVGEYDDDSGLYVDIKHPRYWKIGTDAESHTFSSAFQENILWPYGEHDKVQIYVDVSGSSRRLAGRSSVARPGVTDLKTEFEQTVGESITTATPVTITDKTDEQWIKWIVDYLVAEATP